MSTAPRIAEDVRVRLYGASELGVLTLIAPGDAHPRVEYIAGEVFVGLNREADGDAVTQGETAGADEAFRAALRAAVPRGADVPPAEAGLIVLSDETTALSVLLGGTRVPDGAVNGARVVFPVARDRVVVIGADDSGAAARALDLAEAAYESGGQMISAHPIALGDTGPTPFDWRAAFPGLEMRFERMLRLVAVRAYEAQTEALRRPDVHVAPAKIHVLDSGATTTFAAWPKGTATLLPAVDNVLIADPSGQISVAPLEQFLAAAGDAVVRTGLSPTRYFVPGAEPKGS